MGQALIRVSHKKIVVFSLWHNRSELHSAHLTYRKCSINLIILTLILLKSNYENDEFQKVKEIHSRYELD